MSTLTILLAVGLALVLIAVGTNGYEKWTAMPVLVRVFSIALAVGFTTLLIANPKSLGVGVAGIILGILSMNCAFLFALLATRVNVSSDNLLVIRICQTMPPVGLYLTIISAIHFFIANAYFITHSRQTTIERLQREATDGKRTSAEAVASLAPKCWEMYACPKAVRNRCPNFQDKINCWKRHQGCLCSNALSSYIFQGEPNRHASESTDDDHRLNIAETGRATALPRDFKKVRDVPWSKQRAMCYECSIFLEHQAIKYRRFNVVFLPITIFLIVVLYQPFQVAYDNGIQYLDQISSRLNAMGKMPEGFTFDASALVNSPYEYLLLGVLSLLLMSYVMEYTDKALLTWKW